MDSALNSCFNYNPIDNIERKSHYKKNRFIVNDQVVFRYIINSCKINIGSGQS